MLHSFSRSPALPVLLVALAPAAWAQFTPPDPTAVSWPLDSGLGHGQAFRSSTAGDFNGDTLLDAALQRGNRVIYMDAPASRVAFVAMPLSVNDCDTIPDGWGDGHDALVSVGPNGLQLTALLGTTFQSVTLESADWADAVLVDAQDLDGDDDVDVVGLASNLRTILVRLNNGDGTWTAGSGFTAPADVLFLEGAQHDTGGVMEIAYCTAAKLLVSQLSGGLILYSRTLPNAPRALAVAHRDGEPDAVCVVYPTASAEQLLVVRGGITEPPVALPIQPHAAGIGAADANGYLDLALNGTDAHELRLFTQGDDPTFELAAVFDLGPTGSYAATNLAQPLIADFWSNAAAGMIVGLITTEVVLVYRGPLVETATGSGPLLTLPVAAPCYDDTFDWGVNTEFDGWGRVRLLVWTDPNQTTYSHIQVVTWYRELPGNYTVATADSNTLHDLDDLTKDTAEDAWYVDVPVQFCGGSGSPPECSPGHDSDDRFYFEIRLVSLSGQGIGASSEPVVSAFSLAQSSMTGVPIDTGAGWTEMIDVSPCSGSSGVPAFYVRTSAVGRFPPSSVPTTPTEVQITYPNPQ